MTVQTHGILGQTTDYPKTYSPDILYPIDRQLGRSQLTLPPEQLSLGVDFWQCFEVSWLNTQLISQVAMIRLAIRADSPFIVESKSLKLYLNSLNFTVFNNKDEVIKTIENDLSQCLQSPIKAQIFDVKDSQSLMIDSPKGRCIDEDCSHTVALTDDVNNQILISKPILGETIKQSYYSHLLRSNCPVTNQPDWGTVQIDIDCPLLDTAILLEYLLSYRQHNGFHEQCVEQIFCDLTQAYRPNSLMVRAWYTRRGGIDINPIRVSELSLMPTPSRLNRQ